MTSKHIVRIDDELSLHIDDAQRAARETPTPALAGPMTQRLDPPLPFARTFREYLPEEVQLPDSRLTRSSLLAQGRSLSPNSALPDLRNFLWLVNAWGYGLFGVGVPRTVKVLADPERFETSGRNALTILHDASSESAAVEAFFYLNNEAGHIRGWGPAFFTKFLAFADPANQPDSTLTRQPALILDQWIAAAVNHYLPERYRSRRPSKKTPLGRFAPSAWNTPQYAYYLSLIDRLACVDVFHRPPYDARPMAVERVLFHYFRDGEGRTPE